MAIIDQGEPDTINNWSAIVNASWFICIGPLRDPHVGDALFPLLVILLLGWKEKGEREARTAKSSKS